LIEDYFVSKYVVEFFRQSQAQQTFDIADVLVMRDRRTRWRCGSRWSTPECETRGSRYLPFRRLHNATRYGRVLGGLLAL
jgi:hypothetical protein